MTERLQLPIAHSTKARGSVKSQLFRTQSLPLDCKPWKLTKNSLTATAPPKVNAVRTSERVSQVPTASSASAIYYAPKSTTARRSSSAGEETCDNVIHRSSPQVFYRPPLYKYRVPQGPVSRITTMFGPTGGEGWRKVNYAIKPQPWFVSMSVLPDYEGMAQPSKQEHGKCVATAKLLRTEVATANKSSYGGVRS